MTARRSLVLIVSFSLLAGGGCFKSSTLEASSQSSSDSSASSSRSSSSSSPGARRSAYAQAVRDYTTQFVLTGGDFSDFQAGLAPVAKEHGVSDWEGDSATWEGIGRGLKKSGVSGQRLTSLEDQLSGGDAQKIEWIRRGYARETR